VLVCTNEASSILTTIWHRKHRRLGHVLRHDNLLLDIMEGKMSGKATWSGKMMEFNSIQFYFKTNRQTAVSEQIK